MMAQDDIPNEAHERQKVAAILGVSTFILIVMALVVTVAIPLLDKDDTNSNPISKPILSICYRTKYPQICNASLPETARNTTDPQQLAKAALQAAITTLRDTIENATLLTAKVNNASLPGLKNCGELLRTAVDDVEDSILLIDLLGQQSNSQGVMSKLKVLLSASITYQVTCLDEFRNRTLHKEVGQGMDAILASSSTVTSNGLAIVTSLESTLNSTDGNASKISRRLQGVASGNELTRVRGDFPSWLNSEKTKLLDATPEIINPDIIVAQDGSGQYRTIGEAILKIPRHRNSTFVVYIKGGVYEERINISRSMTHVMIMGDGVTATRIIGNFSYGGGVPTFKTAIAAIYGDHFIARDIGFGNYAGAGFHQAVALKVQSDMSIFYRCRMDGHQGTLYAHSYRQFYRECTIAGTIDFIFGDAAAVFQNCRIEVKTPRVDQFCVVIAQGRNDSLQTTGFVIQNCIITADQMFINSSIYNSSNPYDKNFLGRPWRPYSRTIVMESYIDEHFNPEGWLPWYGNFELDKVFISEYNNWGPGAPKAKRVRWEGIQNLSQQEVSMFTAAKFIQGDDWISSTGTPYAPSFTRRGLENNSTETIL
ncbi:hypothetical protein Tsubulata_045010 [Turnera subulata]|uniref:Pectinesterase n=1 Tax=Turnera subulata TaxID=218843 RepID=A0A9Q0JH15_9ROSI|nr:hypothetical protein Tsubulata_045010 [Turnera subulata]